MRRIVKTGEDIMAGDFVYVDANGYALGLRGERNVTDAEVLKQQYNSLVQCQGDPIPNNGVAVWDLVIEDMRARDAEGRLKYGTPLQANNGRDALVDAYQEALDMAVYLRQLIEERKTGA